MSVPGKLFQPSLMFAGMVGAYPSDAPFQALDDIKLFFILIRLGMKSLSGTNTLAYFENSYITNKKFNNIVLRTSEDIWSNCTTSNDISSTL